MESHDVSDAHLKAMAEIEAGRQAAIRKIEESNARLRQTYQNSLKDLATAIQTLDERAKDVGDPQEFLAATRRAHALLGRVRQIVCRRPETDEVRGELAAPALRGLSPAVAELVRAYNLLLLSLCTRGFVISQQDSGALR